MRLSKDAPGLWVMVQFASPSVTNSPAVEIDFTAVQTCALLRRRRELVLKTTADPPKEVET